MLKKQIEKYDLIKQGALELAEYILGQNKKALKAIKNNDMSALEEVRTELKTDLRPKADSIDNNIISAIALFTPEARDLREVTAFFKLTNEIVRLHSNTASFAKKYSRNFSDDLDQDCILEYAIPLHKSSIEALELAFSMIKMEDKFDVRDCFDQVQLEESKSDDLYKMVEKNILKKTKKDQEFSKDYLDILSALRHLEKNADRALSIAALMYFAKVGGEIRQG